MTSIQVTCQHCGALTVLRPAQILLLADPDAASGSYLFRCPTCWCVTAEPAGGDELQVLLRAGVSDASGVRRPDRPQPRQNCGLPAAHARRPSRRPPAAGRGRLDPRLA